MLICHTKIEVNRVYFPHLCKKYLILFSKYGIELSHSGVVFPKQNLIFHLCLSSANAFNLNQSKILLFSKELRDRDHISLVS